LCKVAKLAYAKAVSTTGQGFNSVAAFGGGAFHYACIIGAAYSFAYLAMDNLLKSEYELNKALSVLAQFEK
jgi:hypothetical protein